MLKTLLHNLKTAKKQGVETTANACRGGYASPVGVAPSNFCVQPSNLAFEDMLDLLGDGLLITDLQGWHAGADAVSGDFSLPARGYRVENGKIAGSVNQITLAGNFFELLKSVEAVGGDLKFSRPLPAPLPAPLCSSRRSRWRENNPLVIIFSSHRRVCGSDPRQIKLISGDQMCIMVPYMQTHIEEMDFMADRRPPQRPANTAVRRNASSGARPAGFPTFGISPLRRATLGHATLRLPTLGAAGNAPGAALRPQRGGKRVSGRFYAFLGIVALIIIAVVLLIWRPWATNPDPVDPGVIAATPAVMAPAADATVAPDAPDAQDAQAENGAERRPPRR